MACLHFLDLQDLHPSIRLPPDLDRHILGDERPAHADPALLPLDQMALQLFIPKRTKKQRGHLREHTHNQHESSTTCRHEEFRHITLHLQKSSPDLSVAAIAVDVHSHSHADELSKARELSGDMICNDNEVLQWNLPGVCVTSSRNGLWQGEKMLEKGSYKAESGI